MATIIQAGSGSTVTKLASLTSVPTSDTAISGTENWKKYDAIYFECIMHYSDANNKAIFTNLILTNNVTTEENYCPIRVSDAGAGNAEINIHCRFSENVININKYTKIYDIVKLNIYGVNF